MLTTAIYLEIKDQLVKECTLRLIRRDEQADDAYDLIPKCEISTQLGKECTFILVILKSLQLVHGSHVEFSS